LQDVAIDRSWLWVAVCFASQAKAEFENHVWPTANMRIKNDCKSEFQRRTTEEILILCD